MMLHEDLRVAFEHHVPQPGGRPDVVELGWRWILEELLPGPLGGFDRYPPRIHRRWIRDDLCQLAFAEAQEKTPVPAAQQEIAGEELAHDRELGVRPHGLLQSPEQLLVQFQRRSFLALTRSR